MIASISLSDLPKGFDLIADGHLHWNGIEKLQGCKFLLTGSTIITQMKKLESENKKSISIFDSKTKEIEFLPLPVQRKMFYEKIKFENATQQQIIGAIEAKLSEFVFEKTSLKPLVRLKLCGSLAKGIANSDINLAETEKKFSEKAILSISREFESESFKTKIAQLREMQKTKKSISELGFELLEKNLEETGFGKEINARQLLELLEQGENEKAIALLEKQAPREPVFDEVASAVKEAVIKEKAREAAAKKAEKVLTMAKVGKSLRSLAANSGLKLEETGPFSRSRNFVPKIGISEEIVTKAFLLAEGAPLADKVYSAGDDAFVFRLKERKEIDAEAFEKEKELLRAKLLEKRREEVFQKWIEDTKGKASLEYNEDLINLRG